MGLADDFAEAVAEVSEEVADLLVDVTHHVGGAHTGFTTAMADVSRQGLVSDRIETVKTADGKEAQSRHKVTFFEHVAVNPEKDRFTVPGSVKAPVLDVRGLQNAEAGGRFLTVVLLG